MEEFVECLLEIYQKLMLSLEIYSKNKLFICICAIVAATQLCSLHAP